MVLKLNELCLNYIAKNFAHMRSFDHGSLHAQHKEKIIERLANHDWLSLNVSSSPDFSRTNEKYQRFLLENFFYGHLKSLKFVSCDQLTDSLLKLIASLNEHSEEKLVVKSIHISRCNKFTDNGLKCLLNAYSQFLEELVLKNLNIPLAQSLGESFRSPKISSIDLTNCPFVTDKDLWLLCKNNPHLASLKLTYCAQLTNNGVRAALNMLNRLESLDIEGIKNSGTGFFLDNTTPNIELFSSINFKSLKRLSFSGSNELNDSKSMKKLFENCIQLRELTIHYSALTSISNTSSPPPPTTTTTTTTTQAFWIPSISNFDNTNSAQASLSIPFATSLTPPIKHLPSTLTVFSLYRPNISNVEILVESLRTLGNLQQLSLYCVECLSDESLSRILKNNGPGLVHLNLGGYVALPKQLTNKCIVDIHKHCLNLTSICFDLFSFTATLEPLKPLFQRPEQAAKFDTVRLSACRSISYDLLNQICLRAVNLRKLDLSGLNQLVDDSLIETLAMTTSRLEFLDVKACNRLTDESICLLATRCPLECLVLAGIGSLTDKVIFTIANHLQSSLSEISLSGCSKISVVALRYLSDCCIKRLYCDHRVPNADPNQLMAKNLDTGHFERVDQLPFYSSSE